MLAVLADACVKDEGLSSQNSPAHALSFLLALVPSSVNNHRGDVWGCSGHTEVVSLLSNPEFRKTLIL